MRFIGFDEKSRFIKRIRIIFFAIFKIIMSITFLIISFINQDMILTIVYLIFFLSFNFLIRLKFFTNIIKIMLYQLHFPVP